MNNSLAVYTPYNSDFIFSEYFLLGTNQKCKLQFYAQRCSYCPVYNKEWLNKLEYMIDTQFAILHAKSVALQTASSVQDFLTPAAAEEFGILHSWREQSPQDCAHSDAGCELRGP